MTDIQALMILGWLTIVVLFAIVVAYWLMTRNH